MQDQVYFSSFFFSIIAKEKLVRWASIFLVMVVVMRYEIFGAIKTRSSHFADLFMCNVSIELVWVTFLY